jgi:hypothetical protein
VNRLTFLGSLGAVAQIAIVGSLLHGDIPINLRMPMAGKTILSGSGVRCAKFCFGEISPKECHDFMAFI